MVGDPTSSNSRHLCEAASATGTRAYQIGSVAELQDAWLTNANVVGVTAGASTPEDVIAEVVDRLSRDGAVLQNEVYVEERVSFRLPLGVAP